MAPFRNKKGPSTKEITDSSSSMSLEDIHSPTDITPQDRRGRSLKNATDDQRGDECSVIVVEPPNSPTWV